MLIAFFWFMFALAVGIWAGRRGRGSGTWFVISLAITPLLGAIFVAALEDLSAGGSSDRTHRSCPACAERVMREARKCKHCGAELTPLQTVQESRAPVYVLVGVLVVLGIAIAARGV